MSKAGLLEVDGCQLLAKTSDLKAKKLLMEAELMFLCGIKNLRLK